MKKIVIVLLIISITLCAVCFVPAAFANLLENGSFETGVSPPSGGYRTLYAVNTDISGWTVSAGDIDWVNTYWIASEGNLSIDLVGYVAGKIEQSFSTSIGQKYVVTFEMAGNPVTWTGVTELRVEAAGQSSDFAFNNTGKSTTNMGWKTNTWAFTANNSTTTLSFMSLGNYNRSGPAIDNVSVLEAVSDCSSSQSQNLGNYDTTYVYQIPVWVHIITNDDGTSGNISDTMVESQIEVLNEDYRALAGTPGAKGTDVRVEFKLEGVDRTPNSKWFTDCYYNNCTKDDGKNENEPFKSLNKDPKHYLNFYTKTWSDPSDPKPLYGYATTNPWDDAGQQRDGVVINWRNFGRNSPDGPPYDQGRTTTHEVGHYLGLLHTFNGGCGSETAPGCYSDGDLICDTNPEAAFNLGCPNPVNESCGSLEDPIHNYMNYTDHTCMEEFTKEQAQRIRCMIENYRSDSCHQFDSSTGMPHVGFGAAYNVLSAEKELLIKVFCGFSHATVKAGSGKNLQYIWHQGYIWRNTKWELFDLRGDDLRYDNWYVGSAKATISVPPEDFQKPNNWLVAYICTWTGTQWKCGCRDESCTERYWQLQKFGHDSEAEPDTAGDLSVLALEDIPPPPPPPPPPDYSKDLVYTPVTPCRIADTRKAGGAISAGGIRSYNVRGSVVSQGGNSAGCPSPKGEPLAVNVNVTSVPLGNGWITAYPYNSTAPTASLVNYRSDAQNVANSGTVKTCTNCSKDISIKSGVGKTHVIIDVLGYYYSKP